MKHLKISVILLLVAFTTLIYAEEQKVTLKGKVIVTNRRHAELKADTKDYLLLMPRPILSNLKDQDEVEIEGFITKNGGYCYNFNKENSNDVSNDVSYVVVTKITHNGKAIELDKNSYRGKGHKRFNSKDENFRGGCGRW